MTAHFCADGLALSVRAVGKNRVLGFVFGLLLTGRCLQLELRRLARFYGSELSIKCQSVACKCQPRHYWVNFV